METLIPLPSHENAETSRLTQLLGHKSLLVCSAFRSLNLSNTAALYLSLSSSVHVPLLKLAVNSNVTFWVMSDASVKWDITMLT